MQQVGDQFQLADNPRVGVRAQALGKSYRRWRGVTTAALRDCEFELPAGSVTALIGANGAGKTTLLSILAGLLTPDSGQLLLPGRTAFVAQEKPVYGYLSPARMLALAARLNQVWDQQRAQEWLERFAVPAGRPCSTLSGGQRTQVALAIAVGSCPDVLLLDEPLSELDPVVRREVITRLLEHCVDTGMTVVLSTHVVAELGGVVDYLLLMAAGTVITCGDVDELLARHVHYIGPAATAPPGPGQVLDTARQGGQSRFLVRLPEHTPTPDVPDPWTLAPVTFEELVRAELTSSQKEPHA